MLSPVPPIPRPHAPSFIVVPPPFRRARISGRTSIFRRPRTTCCTHLDEADRSNHNVSHTTTRKVRLKRSDTCHSASWNWNGGSAQHHSQGTGDFQRFQYQVPFLFRRMFKEAIRRVFSFQDADAIAGKLIRRVLQSLFGVLQRSWYAEELVIEYGITDPNPDDKAYVDPLRDWQPSPITYYHDSFGSRVYLSANSPNGLAIALEFRDYEYDSDDAIMDDTSTRNDDNQKNNTA